MKCPKCGTNAFKSSNDVWRCPSCLREDGVTAGIIPETCYGCGKTYYVVTDKKHGNPWNNHKCESSVKDAVMQVDRSTREEDANKTLYDKLRDSELMQDMT